MLSSAQIFSLPWINVSCYTKNTQKQHNLYKQRSYILGEKRSVNVSHIGEKESTYTGLLNMSDQGDSFEACFIHVFKASQSHHHCFLIHSFPSSPQHDIPTVFRQSQSSPLRISGEIGRGFQPNACGRCIPAEARRSSSGCCIRRADSDRLTFISSREIRK